MATAFRNRTQEAITVGVTVKPGEQVSVTRERQRAEYTERTRYMGRQDSFSFSDMETLHEVVAALTTAQCGYLLLLQCYVEYDTGRLIKPDGLPMTTADMQRVLMLTGRRRSTFYDFMTRAKAAGIIGGTEHFYINPRYHFKGASANRSVIRSYATAVKRAYNEVNAADLGLIYRMLPLVHMKTNALCANPFEPDPAQLRWLNVKEMAALIGVDEKTLIRRLPRMKFDGQYVIARIKLGGGKSREPLRFVFNPNVFYRNTTKPDDTLVAMFAVGSNAKK